MKLSNAQLWLLHTLETLFFGAVVTGGISVYQATTSGTYNLQTLASIFVPAALAVLSKGWSGSISNNANLGTALLDSVNEVKSLVQKTPVTVHVNNPTPALPTRPAPQPIVLPQSSETNTTVTATPNLSQPMQWNFPGIQNVPAPSQNPQEMPAVRASNVSQMPTQQTPALPVQPTSNLLQFAPIDRHWGDTGVQPALGQQSGQGS